MNTALATLYTNEASPELLQTYQKLPFTEQQLSTFDEKALAIIERQQAHRKALPPIAIYRIAAQGSQTRNGGVIEQTTSPLKFKLPSGQHIRAARKGDHAVYPDGSTAQIVTTAGAGFEHAALVGSFLSNGDEIINTPQGSGLLLERKGVPLAEDFLPALER